ncbi:4-diphosphocytidyl-2-C-methyl-D-erythritol kinase (fragment) [Mesorhizobium plurifarium]|uniref:4-diphosphocytidyl-2-C-methyl-D-erythritol kinase n=1 Tax=Mesorhizobium plurifarium TaxID=69974 RepID=A0A090FPK9_MESPL
MSGRYAAGLPLDDGNLVVRARDALRLEAGAQHAPPVAIRLEKNLPIASGVGGGSSDAAAALNGLARLWKLDIDDRSLARIGLSLGADLPMCLKSQPLVARGIGDEVSPLTAFPALGLVLVNPGIAVSTPEVFKALSSRDNEALPPLPKRLDFHAVRNWLEATRNDLEGAARSIEPAIGEALKALKRADAAFARMSGSGATCFGLFETGNVAKRAAIAIRARHPDWFVAATRSMEVSDGEA